METDGRVEKQKYSFSTRRCKTLGGVLHRSHRLHGRQSTNNKTGHFTCYKNRTFLFATDTNASTQMLRGIFVSEEDLKQQVYRRNKELHSCTKEQILGG